MRWAMRKVDAMSWLMTTLVTPVETLDRQVIVVPEIVTNSLIISATDRYFNEIMKIIIAKQMGI